MADGARILVVAATARELAPPLGWRTLLCGIGPVEAAAATSAELARERVGEDRLGLDDAGIAEAGLARRRAGPVDDDNAAAARLQMQRRADPDDPGPQNDDIDFCG